MEYIKYVFIIVLIFKTAKANNNILDFKSKMYQNITVRIEEILSITEFNHSIIDSEREILNKFKEIDNIIKLFEDRIEVLFQIIYFA